jgi:Na+/proline symporter
MPEAVEQLTPGLAGIDKTIVIMYMVGVFALGTFFARYVKNAGDFFVAGKALPFWAIGMSIVVSDIGATDFVAVAGSAYNNGIAAANFDWMGSMPAMVFAAFIFVPYFWRTGVYTIPEFLGRRYNTSVRVIHASIWAVFMFLMLSMMLWITGDQLSHTILGWNPKMVVWLMVAITGIYCFSGGLSAVVMVDVVQLIIMFVGGLALLAISMWEVGGPGVLQEKVAQLKPRAVVTINSENDVQEKDVEEAFKGAGFPVISVADAELDYEKGEGKENFHKFLVRMSTLETPANPQDKPSVMRKTARVEVENALVPLTNYVEEGLSDDEKKALKETENVEINQLMSYESHFKILLPHDTDKPYPWTGIVFGLGIVMAIAYMSGNQVVVQRTLGARSEWDAKGGMLFGGFLKSFIPLMVAVPGLCALVLAPDLPDGERAVPHMIATMLPPGLRGLMFVALFAALMSSVDSTLSSATTIWTNDLYGRLHHRVTGKNLTERTALIMGRVFTIAFVVAAGLFAPVIQHIEGLYEFVQTLLSLFQGPTLAILVLGILWRRANRWGGLAGLVLGVAFTGVLNAVDDLFISSDPFLFVAWWSFVFSLIVTVVVSLLTPAEPEDKIRGLVWGSVMKDGDMQSILRDRLSE